MAIYHLSIDTVRRSKGHSATAAAAYRAAELIVDERTGLVHDYRRRRGVLRTQIVLPDDAPEWARGLDRPALWNAAELREGRKNSVVAREWEASLPAEIPAEARQDLAMALAREVAGRHNVAVDVALHAPSRKSKDGRNYHMHVLATTRRLEADGFGEKTRELDELKGPEKGVPGRGPVEVTRWRQRWDALVNDALAQCGSEARVDCRTLKAQGIDREPQQHMGPKATAMERRGLASDRGEDIRSRQQEADEMRAEMRRIETELEEEKLLHLAAVAASSTAAAQADQALAAELVPPPALPTRSLIEGGQAAVRKLMRLPPNPGPAPPALPRTERLRKRLVEMSQQLIVGLAPPPLISATTLVRARKRLGQLLHRTSLDRPPPAIPSRETILCARQASFDHAIDDLGSLVYLEEMGVPPATPARATAARARATAGGNVLDQLRLEMDIEEFAGMEPPLTLAPPALPQTPHPRSDPDEPSLS